MELADANKMMEKFRRERPDSYCAKRSAEYMSNRWYYEKILREEFQKKGGKMQRKDIEMENQEKQHKRRVRYSGTHPKSYKEKYKEHNPEKYADTIERVIQKGGTPAGMHISICVKEILDFLQIKPGQYGIDATLGYGGHTKAMLQCLEGQGHIYALDVDPIESAKTKERLLKQGFGEEILTVRLQNFADIDLVTKDTGK